MGKTNQRHLRFGRQPRRSLSPSGSRCLLFLASLLLLAVVACNPAPAMESATPPATAIARSATTTSPATPTLRPTTSPSPTATAVVRPTADRSPLPAPPPAEATGDLTVDAFTVVDTEETGEGKQVTLRWASNGASARLLSGISRAAPPHWRLPPSGEVTVVLTETLYTDPPFTLQVFDADEPAAAGEMAETTLPFSWPCAHEYFFTPAPARCPQAAPTSSAAAEQPFADGVMIWLEAADAIYVFYPEGQWERFADTWTEAEPESDPALSPPADRYQPIRGFGKVWRENERVREQLGWATSPELGFTSEFQRPVTEIGAEDDTFYLRTFNGQVFYLVEREPDRGEWGLAASW